MKGRAPIAAPKVEINLNTIITTVLGAIIIWMITTALTGQRENKTTLTKIDTSLPYIVRDVGEVKTAVAKVESVMVTRSELDKKQERTEKIISEVKDEQKRVSDELRIKPRGKHE